MKHVLKLALLGAFTIALSANSALAGSTNVAVAANFTEPVKEIAAAFKAKTGHELVLSFGASGQFFTQITQDAPFEVFLSADSARPKKLADEGLGVKDSVLHLRDRQAGAVEQVAGRGEGRGDAEGSQVRQGVDLQSGRRALWRRGGRDHGSAQASMPI